MNTYHKSQINYDLSQISFLDVMVIKDKTALSTDLYRKPTDSNTLLRGDSFHPRPLIKSPYESGHPISSLRYIRIEMVKMSRGRGDIERKFLRRESFWILRLNTLTPLGLNEQFDLKLFL
jgi:hypothetical protein